MHPIKLRVKELKWVRQNKTSDCGSLLLRVERPNPLFFFAKMHKNKSPQLTRGSCSKHFSGLLKVACPAFFKVCRGQPHPMIRNEMLFDDRANMKRDEWIPKNSVRAKIEETEFVSKIMPGG